MGREAGFGGFPFHGVAGPAQTSGRPCMALLGKSLQGQVPAELTALGDREGLGPRRSLPGQVGTERRPHLSCRTSGQSLPFPCPGTGPSR